MSEYGEPWKLHADGDIENSHGAILLGDGELFPAYMERIVACLNACAGIPTGDLQKLPAGFLKECLGVRL